MLENITLNESNVTASIDAYIHHCLFGYNGVFKCGQQLKCEIINNNLLKIYDGLFINQGRFYRIAPGSYEEIKLENGVVGQKRYDLIVSHFETDGVNEKHEIKVIVEKVKLFHSIQIVIHSMEVQLVRCLYIL